MSDTVISIGDGDKDGEVWPFVYFKLYDYDTGSLVDRTATNEFKLRTPSCVKDISAAGVELEVTNSGQVASDLVLIDWRVVFCTYEGHQPHEGFTVSHYKETGSDPIDSALNMDFIPAKNSKCISIKFPEAPPELRNLYFQARVSLLWSPAMPKNEWDFATDICVTEAHRRF